VTLRGKYKLRRRARQQEMTRQRIIEAAVSLHSQVGPARTTISEVAKLAGVQRPTVYRHFPDQLALFTACSGYGSIAHPLPDPARWSKVSDPKRRLRVGLDDLYAYYSRHAERLSKILGDAETMPTLQSVNEVALRSRLDQMQRVLAGGSDSSTRSRAVLSLVVQFYTWRCLARQGLKHNAVVELAARMVEAAVHR
jgi:AcrR family transcriptional regulator